MEHAECHLPGVRAQPISPCVQFPLGNATHSLRVSYSPVQLLCTPLCLAAHVHFSPTLTNVNLLPSKGFWTGVWGCQGNSCLGEGKSPVVFKLQAAKLIQPVLLDMAIKKELVGKKYIFCHQLMWGQGGEYVLIVSGSKEIFPIQSIARKGIKSLVKLILLSASENQTSGRQVTILLKLSCLEL